MALLGAAMDRCADLWGAVIRQAARDAGQAMVVVPKRPRPGERAKPFKTRKRRAEIDQHRGLASLRWFHGKDFHFICGLCGADPDHILGLLRAEGLRV